MYLPALFAEVISPPKAAATFWGVTLLPLAPTRPAFLLSLSCLRTASETPRPARNSYWSMAAPSESFIDRGREYCCDAPLRWPTRCGADELCFRNAYIQLTNTLRFHADSRGRTSAAK